MKLNMSAVMLAQLVLLLQRGELTLSELAEETGLCYATVRTYTKQMHRVGAIHISHWDENDRGAARLVVYKMGAGKDAKRPKQTSATEKSKYRARKRLQGRLIQATAGAL